VPEPRRTGLVYDERCLTHLNPPRGLPFGTFPEWTTTVAFERPERLTETWRVLEGSGVLEHVVRVDAWAATEHELELAHSDAHVHHVLGAARSEEPVNLGFEAWTVPGSEVPALLAAGGLLAATDHVLSGELDNAFALLRPPGHHAEHAASMGFCLFNNLVIAARWAQREHGVERVAILDWDVHHGNGTEEILYRDGSVLAISLHQDRLYPSSTGGLEARGEGEGEGRNVNLPLPAFTGDAGYAHAFDRVVEPVIRAFRPDLLLLGAGQDAAASDPLGGMALTTPGYRALTDRVVALAGELCGGRLVANLEGGYSLHHLPLANLAILEGLLGVAPAFEIDPIGCDVPEGLRDEVRAAVAAAERAHLV
jgi:acetoin utilization deacetylase AcuC-like enzyme